MATFAARTVAERPWLLFALGLALMQAALHPTLLMPGRLPYSPHSDLITEHLATKQVLYAALRSGAGIPGWRFDQWSGSIAAGNPQAQYEHPLHVLFALVAPENAAGPTLWLLWYCASIGAALWAAAMGLGWIGRATAALCVACSLQWLLCTYAGWLPPLTTLACIPGMFAALERCMRVPGSSGVLALMLAAGLAASGGGSQQLLLAAISGAPWLIQLAISGRRDLRQALGRVLLAGAGALALSAPWWLPLVHDVALTSRAAELPRELRGNTLQLQHFAQLLDPDALGHGAKEPWEGTLHFGWVAPALIVAACASSRRRTGLGLAIGFALAVALAFESPLRTAALQLVPALARFRGPARSLHIAALFAAPLAALGADAIASRVAHRGARLGLLGAGALLMFVPAGLQSQRYLGMDTPAELLAQPGWWPAYIAKRAADRGDRVLVVGRAAFNYGLASRIGLELINGYDPYHYAHTLRVGDRIRFGRAQGRWLGNWLDVDRVLRWDLVDRLNARFVLSTTALQRADHPLQLLWSSTAEPVFHFYRGVRRQPAYLYLNEAAAGRAQFAPAIFTTNDASALQHALERFDAHKVSVLEAAAGFAGTQPTAAQVLTWRHAVDGQIEISTQCERTAVLTVAETWHPGWHATVDDAPAALLRADDGLMALAVPAGRARIRLTFELPWRGRALALALAALALALGATARTRLKSKSAGAR